MNGWEWEGVGQAGELAAAFVLEVANISRAGGDALDTLILTAIAQANQALIRQDRALQQRYAAASAALPDELRRPISINAVAESLRLSYETTRRHTERLTQAGLCVTSKSGLVVPEAVVTAPWYVERQQARVAALTRLLRSLGAAGLLATDAGAEPFLHTHVRAVDRVIGDYMLRACDRLMRLAGDAQAGLVLLALWAGAPVRGASCAQIASSIGAPYETARRRLCELAGRDLAVRTGAEWWARWPADSGALVETIRTESLADLRRLHANLEALRPEA